MTAFDSGVSLRGKKKVAGQWDVDYLLSYSGRGEFTALSSLIRSLFTLPLGVYLSIIEAYLESICSIF